MNQFLKSLFISTYPVVCLVGTVKAVLLYEAHTMAAIGLFMMSTQFLIFLGRLFLTKTPRTKAHLPSHSILIGIGTCIVLLSLHTESILFALPLLAGWLLYLFWYSPFHNRLNPKLDVGQVLPNFVLEDYSGQEVSTDTLRGKSKILLFYRGNWCPLCTAQIDELVAEYKILKSKGIETLLISPQSQRHSKKLADKHQVNFRFLVDKDNVLAKQWQLFSEKGLPMGLQVLGYKSDTVMPTVILTDADDKIIYSDLTSNYRVRPEPSDFLPYFN